MKKLTYLECADLLGRKREICRGESGLSRDKENQYRRHWGLADLPSDAPHETRPATEPPRRSLIIRAWTFAKALKRHAADGFRRRTRAKIDTLAAICEACEHFDGRACQLCGCSCSTRETEFFNKLAWESESCPEKKWPV